MRRSSAARRHSTIPTTSAIVIHNYRWRLGLAEGEPRYDSDGAEARAGAGDQRSDHHARG